jgi:hypothetical protein
VTVMVPALYTNEFLTSIEQNSGGEFIVNNIVILCCNNYEDGTCR